MTHSRGALYFHRLFTVSELGLGNDPEPFVNRLIREFLKVGEAVAGRWIEMPRGILILQMVSDRPDTGAIYLYDRTEQIFYMIGFDGSDDNLTVDDFNQLLEDYELLKFAEQPNLIRLHAPVRPTEPCLPCTPMASDSPEFEIITTNDESHISARPVRWLAKPRQRQFWFQSPGSA